MRRGNTDLDRLLTRLRRAGFKRANVEALFPSWWTRDAAADPGAVFQLKVALSRRLGVDLESLLDDKAQLKSVRALGARYKLREGTEFESLLPSESALAALAQIVSVATRHLPRPVIDRNPLSVRESILRTGARTPSFPVLVDWMWRNGIPVIVAADLPGKAKMDAAVLGTQQRPIIFLTRKQPISAWQLFILAHEIGHLGSGHVTEGHSLLESDIETRKKQHDSGDAEERAADLWASYLLSGADHLDFVVEGPLSPNGLARAALDEAKKLHVDAGHLVLVFAFQTNNWPLANETLKVLEPEPFAFEVARRYAASNLDWKQLSDENQEFLKRVITP